MDSFWEVLKLIFGNPEKYENQLVIIGLIIIALTGLFLFKDVEKAVILASNVVSGLIGYISRGFVEQSRADTPQGGAK